MSWSFYNPTSVSTGLELAQIKSFLQTKKTLIVTTKGTTKRGITKRIEDYLTDYKVFDDVSPNPGFSDLESLAAKFKAQSFKQIVAVGGGSSLDMAKILSYALSDESPEALAIVNILKEGKTLPVFSPIPMIAIPTTSGTGSEVTPFATIWDHENKKKYSIGNSKLYPKTALLMPELTYSLPWDITLSTGLDALSQLLESVWNNNSTPITDGIALKGVSFVFEALPVLKNDLKNKEARSKIQLASMMSGLCISQTRTAMAHAISYPLTAHYGTPHGIACSFTLPDLWKNNLSADQSGRLFEFSQKLEKGDLEVFLERFLRELDFKTEFLKTIKTATQVTRLSDEMFTPGRSDNNLFKFDSVTLPTFLDNSVRKWI